LLAWEGVQWLISRGGKGGRGTYMALSKNIITPPIRKNPPVLLVSV
jgi:hypothetical protein